MTKKDEHGNFFGNGKTTAEEQDKAAEQLLESPPPVAAPKEEKALTKPEEAKPEERKLATCPPFLTALAVRYGADPQDLKKMIYATVIPAKSTAEGFAAFLLVCDQLRLNPLAREIYAFERSDKAGGGLQPIIGIDGWLKIINTHPDCDGFTVRPNYEDGKLISATAIIHRKSWAHPVEVTEFLAECKRNTSPWNQWPDRMLRHKAIGQCARYAFGLTGVIDEDEAERWMAEGVIRKPALPPSRLPRIPGESQWKNAELQVAFPDEGQPETAPSEPDGEVVQP